MQNKKIFIFISGLFYGGLFSVFFRELTVIYYDSPIIIIFMIILWAIGTYLGIKFGNYNKIKTDKNIKNIILWIYLPVILIFYFIKLKEKLALTPTFKIHFLFVLLILFASLLLGFLIKIVSQISIDCEKYPVSLLLFGIGISPLFFYYLTFSGLNNWFGALTFGIIYLGFLILFIEKGRNRLLPILYVIPIFAFSILANNNILKNESTGFHLIKYFETETGQYFIVDKNKKVYFYRNFNKLYMFPFSPDKIKKYLNKRKIQFGDVLILNNNPAIINGFTATGLFNIEFYLGEPKFYFNLSYDFPAIIRTLLESNVKILKTKESDKKRYNLILLPEYNHNELFSRYYYNSKRLLSLIESLKEEGEIIAISNTGDIPFNFFNKTDKNFYILRKKEKNIKVLKNHIKKRDLKKLLMIFLIILPLYSILFIFKKGKYLLIPYSILTISFISFSISIYINNNFDIYGRASLMIFSLFIGIWLGYLLLSNIKISKLKVTIFSILPFIILSFISINYIDFLFYISQILFGFLYIGLFLSIEQK